MAGRFAGTFGPLLSMLHALLTHFPLHVWECVYLGRSQLSRGAEQRSPLQCPLAWRYLLVLTHAVIPAMHQAPAYELYGHVA